MVIRPGQAGGHLDPLEVAEHAEGLLAADRATAVETHLSSCEQCRELAASVAGVTATLAAEPRELPMPDNVAARIDAALAEAATARTAASEPRSEGFWAGLRGRLPAIAAAAASVAVLGLIGYSLAGTGGGDDAATTTDAGAGIAESDDAPDSAEAPMEAEEEAPADDESADLEAEEDAGEATRGDEDDGADAGEGAETFDTDVSAGERDALTSELQDILAAHSTRAEPGADGQPCGTVLSEELGGELLGAADTDLVQPGSVLVAIDVGDPDTVSGWVLPDCTAGPDDATFDFAIPRPPAE